MNSPKWIWLLAFSLGLNAVLIAAMALRKTHRDEAYQIEPLPVKREHLLVFDEGRLNLSPEQRDLFAEIRRRWDEEEWNRRVVSIECMLQLAQRMARDDLSTETLKPHLIEIRDCSDAFYQRLVQALRRHRGVLDENQNELFTEVLAERYLKLKEVLEERKQAYQNRLESRAAPVSARSDM